METWLQAIRFLHILTVVFMAAPLYNLIIVNERGLLGPKLDYKVDCYMENLIRKNSVRCYIFQITVLVTGIALVYLDGLGFSSIFYNWVLLLKTLLVLTLMGLLSFVHFGLQPKIDAGLSRAKNNPIPEEIATTIRPLRLTRKRLASVCLFLVITTIIIGLQVFENYTYTLTFILIVLAALFSWRVYKGSPNYGWV
jgi:hypothetical protein